MRRGTRLIGVLTTAALFTIGMSMTALAAGWTEESEGWAYYNKDGSAVTNEWKKSGNNWCWLGSDGLVVEDMLIEDDDDYYYVDSQGFMVTNQWVQVENTDDDDDDAPSNWYYYFTGNGKAFKAPESGVTKLYTINGKKYAFTDEGKMLFGWVDENSTRQTEEDAWETCIYYLGDEDDGAAVIGWEEIPVIDKNRKWDKKEEETEDQTYWFYFQSNGRKLAADEDETLKLKTINGKKYGFDRTGRMVSEWTQTAEAATDCNASGGSSVDDYLYFSDRDSGALVSKGWFKTVPNSDINEEDYKDEEERWYYAYSAGKICASEFRTINGKRYAFDNSGRMLSGLQAIYIDGAGRLWNKKLNDEDLMKDGTAQMYGGATSLELIDEEGKVIEGRLLVREALEYDWAGEDDYGSKKPTYGIYYFGEDDDGSASRSQTNVDVDGEKYTFYFKKDGADQGKGINGIKDGYLYQEGRRVKANKDNKYEAYLIAADPEKVAGNYQDAYENYCMDYSYYYIPGHAYQVNPDMVNRLVNDVATKKIYIKNSQIILVNTSGSMVKGTKSNCKDGNDYYYEVTNGSVTSYYSKGEGGKKDLVGESPHG